MLFVTRPNLGTDKCGILGHNSHKHWGAQRQLLPVLVTLQSEIMRGKRKQTVTIRQSRRECVSPNGDNYRNIDEDNTVSYITLFRFYGVKILEALWHNWWTVVLCGLARFLLGKKKGICDSGTLVKLTLSLAAASEGITRQRIFFFSEASFHSRGL